MDPRLELHNLLCSKLGSQNVYFQPPENLKINYDAIVYSLDGVDQKYADNITYSKKRRYLITHIFRNPENDLIYNMTNIEYCRFIRRFVTDNLYHDVYEIYY